MTLGLPTFLALAIFPAGVIVAALKDATSFTIPNWISGLLAAAYFPVALALHLPLAVMGVSAGVAVAALVAGMGMFAMGWCGGGDAKLFTACALWLGLPGLLPFLAFTGLTGGVLAAGLIAARNGIIGAYASSGPPWLGRLLTVDEDLPYGLAIAVGALAAFPSSVLVAAAARI